MNVKFICSEENCLVRESIGESFVSGIWCLSLTSISVQNLWQVSNLWTEINCIFGAICLCMILKSSGLLQSPNCCSMMVITYLKVVSLIPTIDVSSKEFYGEGYDDSNKRIPDMTIINKQLGEGTTSSYGGMAIGPRLAGSNIRNGSGSGSKKETRGSKEWTHLGTRFERIWVRV